MVLRGHHVFGGQRMTVSIVNTEVDVCNIALDFLGVTAIEDLEDASKQARLCNRNYAKMRDELLRQYFWNEAIGRLQLTKVTTVTPPFEFEAYYEKPSDLLRPIRLFAQEVVWREEGEYFASTSANEEDMQMEYVKTLTDVTKFSPTFTYALAYRLAAFLAYPLIQSGTQQKAADAKAKEYLKDAKSLDSMIGTPQSLQNDEWNNARESGVFGVTSGKRQYYWDSI